MNNETKPSKQTKENPVEEKPLQEVKTNKVKEILHRTPTMYKLLMEDGRQEIVLRQSFDKSKMQIN